MPSWAAFRPPREGHALWGWRRGVRRSRHGGRVKEGGAGLLPDATAGDIVVMDKLRAHKVAGIEEAITGCGARLISLPRIRPIYRPLNAAGRSASRNR